MERGIVEGHRSAKPAKLPPHTPVPLHRTRRRSRLLSGGSGLPGKEVHNMTTQIIIVALVALLVGFLIGWLAEWALDLLRWRARAKWAGFDLEGRIGGEGIVRLEAGGEGDYAGVITEYLEKRDAEIHELQAKVEAKEAQFDVLQARFDEYVQTHPDELAAIRGIGRIYQWKLRDGGINSYAQLAQTTPERVRQILNVPAWRRIEPESWIEQAKALARRG